MCQVQSVLEGQTESLLGNMPEMYEMGKESGLDGVEDGGEQELFDPDARDELSMRAFGARREVL